MRTHKTLALLSWLACLGLLAQGYVPAPARADDGTAHEETLLALGDSIAFGYDPTQDFSDEANFKGYAERFKSDYQVENAACPGETTGSFLSTSAADNGCRSYRSAYPLHVSYDGAQTQLEYAIARLTNQDPDHPITLVTLNLSANDIFLLQQSCSADPANYQTCFSNGLPLVIGAIQQNLDAIFTAIRDTAGYQGRIVFMNLYTVDYTDASAVNVVGAVNMYATAVATSHNAEIADAFGAFAAAANNAKACDAGLLVKLDDGTCDVHPSNNGDKVLAQAIENAQ